LEDFGWAAVLFNCDCHEFNYVVAVVMRVAGLTYTDAVDVTDTADRSGQSVVIRASKGACEVVVAGLSSAGLKASVERAEG